MKNIMVLIFTLLFLFGSAFADITSGGGLFPSIDPELWASNQTVYIGYAVNGELTIDQGSSVVNGYCYMGRTSGSVGTVNVDGDGSAWSSSSTVYVGYRDKGEINITNGADVSVGYYAYMAYDSGTDALVNVDGKGSTWNISTDLHVGYYGDAELNVSNGATVSSRSGYIGRNAGSTGQVSVNGAGTQWNLSSGLFVGGSGTGSLDVLNGARVNCTGCSIGDTSSGNGIVKVAGVGSILKSEGVLRVGNQGSGRLEICNGGLVRAGSYLPNSHIDEFLVVDSCVSGVSCVNMSTGGMLALYGDGGDSIQDFLELVGGSDAINFYNEVTVSWDNITMADLNVDYTLEYFDDTNDELYGYTLLTVGTVPEPCMMLLLGFGGVLTLRRK